MCKLINLAVLAAFMTLCIQPAMADSDVCRMPDGFLLESGIGGTGVQQAYGTPTSAPDKDNTQGLGGTGIQAAVEKGIGGTGIGSGIGGTGKPVDTPHLAYIEGTIYAHGSICVNGLRITYADDTPTRINGQTSVSAALQLGQVVGVVATIEAGQTTLAAREIHIDYIVQGPIIALDAARHELTVMGERIHVADSTDLAQLKAGQLVQIGGLRDHTGVIQASQVRIADVSVPSEITGPVRLTDSQHGLVGTTPVVLPRNMGKVPDGESIRVQGTWDGSLFKVDHVEPVRDDLSSGVRYLSLEGYVTEVRPDGHVRIGEHVVRSDKAADLREGTRLIVSGPVADDGAIEVEALHQPPALQTHGDAPLVETPGERKIVPSQQPVVPQSPDEKHSEREEHSDHVSGQAASEEDDLSAPSDDKNDDVSEDTPSSGGDDSASSSDGAGSDDNAGSGADESASEGDSGDDSAGGSVDDSAGEAAGDSSDDSAADAGAEAGDDASDTADDSSAGSEADSGSDDSSDSASDDGGADAEESDD